MTTRVSVIIPLHRYTDVARRCVETAVALGGDVHEVLVVSDREIEGLPDGVRALTTGSDVDTSPAQKRDFALTHARGEICAFIDDDAWPADDWLTRALERFDSDPAIAAIGGPGVTPPDSSFAARAGGAFYETPLGSGSLRNRFIAGGEAVETDDWPAFNFFVRREALSSIGGWASKFYGGEDTKLCLTLVDAGYRIVADPNVVVFHARRPIFGPHMRQVHNVGRHRGWFVRTYPRTSARPVYFAPSLALLAAPAIALWGWRAPPPVAGRCSPPPSRAGRRSVPTLPAAVRARGSPPRCRRCSPRATAPTARGSSRAFCSPARSTRCSVTAAAPYRPGVSVIMATLNAEKYLDECLGALRSQDYPRELVEIVIADGGSTDRTLEIARRHGVDLILDNPLRTGEAGKAVALRAARHELILHVDSDNIVVGRDWLTRMVAPLADPEVTSSEALRWEYRREDHFINRYQALTGINDPMALFIGNYDRYSELTGRWTDYPYRSERHDGWEKVWIDPRHVPTMGANGYMVRRDAYELVVIGDYLFDIDVVYDLVQRGRTCVARVDVPIRHYFCDSVASLLLEDAAAHRRLLLLRWAGPSQLPMDLGPAAGRRPVHPEHAADRPAVRAGPPRDGPQAGSRVVVPPPRVLDHPGRVRDRHRQGTHAPGAARPRGLVPVSGVCPACGSAPVSHAFSVGDCALRSVPGEFAYSRCDSCRSVFADPPPDPDTLAAAYGSGYGNYRSRRGTIERLAEPVLRREARRVVEAGPRDRPLVEIGCGTGRFLERLAASGWTGPISGVEYLPAVAADTGRRTGFAVSAGTAEEALLDGGPYGAIVLRHVIEHLREPHAVVARLSAALHSRGVLYIATPDATAWAARVFGRRWWGYEVPRHLVVFSSGALRGAVSRAGLRATDERWSFAPEMWNASLYLALDRGRGLRWPRLLTSVADPLVTGPAFLAAAAEVAFGHSTMYSVIGRRT